MYETVWLAVAMFVVLAAMPGGAYLAALWLRRRKRASSDRPDPSDSAVPERTVPGGSGNNR
jgi:hypothetical protein